MKRILAFACLVALLGITACNKSNEGPSDNSKATPTAEFATVLYTVQSLGSVDIAVNLDKEASKALSIPVTFGGSAAKGTDYAVSAEAVSIAAGAKSGSITLTDKALTADKTVTLTLQAGDGYKLGTKYLTTVSVEAPESLVYNFTAAKTELIESATVTITLTGEQSGASFKAAEDLQIPVKITGADAAAVVLSANAFTVPKGQNSASLTLTPDPEKTAGLTSDARVKVEVDRAASARTLLPGDIEAVTVKLHSGLQVPARLAGTWTFDRVYDIDEIELWFMEMEDDPDELPTHNEGFTLTFTEDEETGEVTLTPGTEGDLVNYFRTATVTLTAPKNVTAGGQVKGQYTASELNMFMAEDPGYDEPVIFTYYKLSSVNRSFDNSAESLGEAVISFRLNDDGNLEMALRDYDDPPFGFMWWDPDNFDADMFGFASLFVKN